MKRDMVYCYLSKRRNVIFEHFITEENAFRFTEEKVQKIFSKCFSWK